MDNAKKLSNIKRNRIICIIANALRMTALICATGTLMQTLLFSLGFDEKAVGIHTTLLQAANVITIVLCSKWADKGNIFKRCGIVLVVNGITFLGFLPACIANNASAMSYMILVGIGVIQQITIGLNTVCEYKLPYFIYDADDYGIIAAIGGVISAVIQIGVSSLIAYMQKFYEYSYIMIAAFIVSGIFMVLSGVCNFMYKSIIDMEKIQQMNVASDEFKAVSFKDVFFHPVFIKLLPANLLRGFANGTTLSIAIMAHKIGFSDATIAETTPIQSVATFAGCVLFGIVTTKISPRISAFAGSIFLCIGLPLLALGSKAMLFAGVGMMLFGRMFVDSGVPSALIKAVPVEIAGTYNAWRMILHNVGTLLATALAPFFSVSALIVVTFVCSAYSGFCFLLSKELRQVSPAIIKREKQC